MLCGFWWVYDVQWSLAYGLGWGTLACIEDQRVDSGKYRSKASAKATRVERDGVKITRLRLMPKSLPVPSRHRDIEKITLARAVAPHSNSALGSCRLPPLYRCWEG